MSLTHSLYMLQHNNKVEILSNRGTDTDTVGTASAFPVNSTILTVRCLKPLPISHSHASHSSPPWFALHWLVLWLAREARLEPSGTMTRQLILILATRLCNYWDIGLEAQCAMLKCMGWEVCQNDRDVKLELKNIKQSVQIIWKLVEMV